MEALGTFALWVLGAVILLAILLATLAVMVPFLAGLFGWPWLAVEWAGRRVAQRLPRMRLRPIRLRTVLIILLVMFAWFVWPTPYRDLSRYEHINRFTGAVCPLSEMCWWR